MTDETNIVERLRMAGRNWNPDAKEAADEIERLRAALEEVDSQLTNAQPHIASIADRYGPDAIAFIDPHIDMAIEAARRALSGKTT
jgi:hypothetical protein